MTTPIDYNAPGIPAQLITALHNIARMTPDYPPALLAARRAEFARQVEEMLDCVDIATPEVSNPLDARRWEIVAALQDEFIDKATAFELLEELAEIITRQE